MRLLHHLAIGEEIEAVAWAHLLRHGDGANLTLDGLLYGLHLHTDLFDGEADEPRSWSRDDDLIADLDLTALDGELPDTDLGEVLVGLSHIDLLLRGRRAVVRCPFPKALPEVIAVPEATELLRRGCVISPPDKGADSCTFS